jgi:hypothetical protein
MRPLYENDMQALSPAALSCRKGARWTTRALAPRKGMWRRTLSGEPSTHCTGIFLRPGHMPLRGLVKLRLRRCAAPEQAWAELTRCG